MKSIKSFALTAVIAMMTANAALAQYVIHVPPKEDPPAIVATPPKHAPSRLPLREVFDVSPAPTGPGDSVAWIAIMDRIGADPFGDKGCPDQTKITNAERLSDGTIRATCSTNKETFRIFRVGRKIWVVQCSVAVRISDC